jgi:hypothetical protein
VDFNREILEAMPRSNKSMTLSRNATLAAKRPIHTSSSVENSLNTFCSVCLSLCHNDKCEQCEQSRTEQTLPNKRRCLKRGKSIVTIQYWHCSINLLYILDLLSSTTTNENALAAQALLNTEFQSHRDAAAEFPPTISPETICSAVSSFQQALASHAERSVCSACGIFSESGLIKKIHDNEKCLESLKEVGLDKCGYKDGYWLFCPKCHIKILQGKIPKFSALNSINVIMCHDYPSALKDLTFVEECVIARRHPIGRILKLRPGNRRSPSNYYALRGHMIVLPQDPGPLLHLLPSPQLKFQDLIKVFWIGKCRPPSSEEV